MTPNANMPKADRREAARAQAAALKEAQLKREARARMITFGSIIVGLLIIGALIFWIVAAGGKKSDEAKQISGSVAAPSVAASDGAITFGKDLKAGSTNEGGAKLALYFDYMCPACGSFESTNSANIEELVKSGDVTFEAHPIAILDRYSSGTDYSTRAASAFAYVADKAPEAAWKFHALLFANQPEENSSGLTDEELGKYAVEAGASQEVGDAITKGDAKTAYGDWVTSATSAASASATSDWGQSGLSTPTALINGKVESSWSDAAQFKELLLAGKS